MLLTRKKDGNVKGCLVFNGKGTRSWVSREDKSSLTVLAKSLMLTCVVDAHEKRDVISLDIPNAYIQVEVSAQKHGERVVMKIRGQLVDWLCEIAPTAYLPYVVIERGVQGLYLLVTKAIYGIL